MKFILLLFFITDIAIFAFGASPSTADTFAAPPAPVTPHTPGPPPTRTSTATATPVTATATRTATPVSATATRTSTPVTATATRTSTPVTATATRTSTPAAATATRTPTKAPATATRTPTKALVRNRASPAFAFTYQTSFQIQNLAPITVANISMVFYNQSDGSVAATVTDTVSAGGSKTYFPIPGVSSGFNGSTVVSSDQPVASIANVVGGAFAALASYDGQSQGSTSVSVPLLMKNNSGYNTWFNVQNAGSISATAYSTYSDGTSASMGIQPGGAKTFDQATESHSLAVFSGIVTSTQPLVVSAIEENTSTLFSYNGFTSGSTNPVMPLINANNSGYITGIQIQNTGSLTTSVTVSYTHSSVGTDCTETQSVPAGQSKTFALGAFATGAFSTCVGGATFVGSGRVTTNSASQPLVAIVNQLKSPNGGAYGAFDPNAATQKVVMPLIMDRNSGYFTGFSVMNVGGGSTTVNCSFTGTGYTAGTPIVLAAGQAFNTIQQNQIANAYVGSGTCTASAGGDKIVAVVNELSGAAGDQLLVYEGVNQ